MRRWKVIDGGNSSFKVGDIIRLYKDTGDPNPLFCRIHISTPLACCSTYRLEEIDEKGNTIRTYKKGDRLNKGTLVGGSMNKLKKLEEQYKKLGEEIQALKKETEFVPGWYMYWDDNQADTNRHLEYLKSPVAGSMWDHVVLVTQELLNQFLPK